MPVESSIPGITCRTGGNFLHALERKFPFGSRVFRTNMLRDVYCKVQHFDAKTPLFGRGDTLIGFRSTVSVALLFLFPLPWMTWGGQDSSALDRRILECASFRLIVRFSVGRKLAIRTAIVHRGDGTVPIFAPTILYVGQLIGECHDQRVNLIGQWVKLTNKFVKDHDGWNTIDYWSILELVPRVPIKITRCGCTDH